MFHVEHDDGVGSGMFHVERRSFDPPRCSTWNMTKKPSESEDVNPTPPVRFAHGLSSAGQQQL